MFFLFFSDEDHCFEELLLQDRESHSSSDTAAIVPTVPFPSSVAANPLNTIHRRSHVSASEQTKEIVAMEKKGPLSYKTEQLMLTGSIAFRKSCSSSVPGIWTSVKIEKGRTFGPFEAKYSTLPSKVSYSQCFLCGTIPTMCVILRKKTQHKQCVLKSAEIIVIPVICQRFTEKATLYDFCSSKIEGNNFYQAM